MDYKQLQFFLAVCEAQSFRNAAARCYVSQQAISKSLSNLEQELGVQLFVRNQNGVSLTEAGQQLEKLARPHLNQRDEFLRQMRSFSLQAAAFTSDISWDSCRSSSAFLPAIPGIPSRSPAALPQLYRYRTQPLLS